MRCNGDCDVQPEATTPVACTARLKEGTTTLAPLPKKALIRDMVTEIAPLEERLERSPPRK
jgi:succinate dehydrogenase/fumarate reductase-like Fe-S protein